MEAKGWQDERLKVMVLQAVALQAHGEKDKAVQLLGEALALAEPGGFIRLFVDEGAPMASYCPKQLLAGICRTMSISCWPAFQLTIRRQRCQACSLLRHYAQSLGRAIEPRELEVLRLIAQGLSNQEISERLFLALDTVKGHNRRIFDKLQVQRRTEAIARARELGLL